MKIIKTLLNYFAQKFRKQSALKRFLTSERRYWSLVFKQVRLDATPSKCMPPPLSIHTLLYNMTLNYDPVTLKIFSAMPIPTVKT